jgi:hypothetical protein
MPAAQLESRMSGASLRELLQMRRTVLGEPLLAHAPELSGVHTSWHTYFADDHRTRQREENDDGENHEVHAGSTP